ncbi:SDR family oxidoreductase [Streptomyces sp. NPDC059697]|uniref:SDR family oxidoreductase n=1 Tax=Streptomyces sp. NPDC059697 TaxID=3346912 RepID=UPI0036BF7FCD
MRVFVTGATGFVGSAVVRELLDAGHQVLGLARSDQAAASLTAAGAQAHRGALDDVDSLRAGADAADGVIHTAFQHGSSDFAAAARTELRAIQRLGETLVGSGRPFVVTSGTAGLTLVPGRVATEDDEQDLSPSPAAARIRAETEALSFAERGVRASVVRLPPSVHGEGDHGFVPQIIAVARAKGVSAYPGDGSNRWAAGHRLDAAHLYRLALEEAPGGARLHAIGDEGVPVRDIADAVGRYLKLPVAGIPREKAADHFGWLGHFFSMDLPASSTLTQKRLGWRPERPGLVEDLEEGHYFTKS